MGLYGRDYVAAWCTQRSHWAYSGDVRVDGEYVAPLWDLAEPPHMQGHTWTPNVWWLRTTDGLMYFLGWLGGRLAADEGHLVGLTYEGVVLCPRFGEVQVDSVDAVVAQLLRRMPNISQAWYYVVPPLQSVGHWDGANVLGPDNRCWYGSVGRRQALISGAHCC